MSQIITAIHGIMATSAVLALACGPVEAAVPLVRSLRAADHAVSQGTVIYNVRPFDANLGQNGPPNRPYRLSLGYSGEDRVRRTRRNIGPGPSLPLTEIRDGRHHLFVDPGSIQVTGMSTFPGGSGSVPEDLMMLTPGACSVMGRGLTRLRGLMVASGGAAPVVEGVAADGTGVRAVLDPQHGWIARVIERRTTDGRVIGRWSLASPVRSRDGVWLPSQATLIAYRFDGQRVATTRYQLVRADFREPPSATFTVALAGKSLIDQRFGIPVGFQQTTSRVPSLDQALAQTQWTAGQLATMHSAETRWIKIALRITGLTILAGMAGAFIWALWALGQKRRAA